MEWVKVYGSLEAKPKPKPKPSYCLASRVRSIPIPIIDHMVMLYYVNIPPILAPISRQSGSKYGKPGLSQIIDSIFHFTNASLSQLSHTIGRPLQTAVRPCFFNYEIRFLTTHLHAPFKSESLEEMGTQGGR